MESVKEIKTKCYPKEVRSSIPRYLSLYITWWALKFKLSANFISVVGAIFASCGAILLFFNSANAFAVAVFCFLCFYMLDFCDGNVARYTDTASLGGLFLDDLIHFYIGPLIKFMLAFSIYNVINSNYIIFLGLISAYPSAPDFVRFFAIVEHLRNHPDSIGNKSFIKLINYSHYKPFKQQQKKLYNFLSQIKMFFSQPAILFLIMFVLVADTMLSISIYGSSSSIEFFGCRLGLIIIMALLNIVRQLFMSIKHIKDLKQFS